MKDLIDRQAAIDVLDKIFPVAPMRNDYTQGITCGAALATEYIKQLPSVQQLIPCSEMLPEVGESVLCQCRAGIFMVLKRTEDRSWKQDSTHVYMHGFVIAWMPLPEPYKEEISKND